MTSIARPGTPTLAEIKIALERSGYLLEARLTKQLERLGFRVLTNVPYPDPVTGLGDSEAVTRCKVRERRLASESALPPL